MNRPTLVILVGIPGSGKTHYAQNYISNCQKHTVHLSSDGIRAELYGDESVQGNPVEVFSLMQKRAVEALNSGYDVIYDSTAMTRKDRAGIITACPKFVKIEAHIIWAPIETCIERDAARDRTVGKAVIDKMLKRFQAPYFDEGIDEIKIIRPEGWDDGKYIGQRYKNMCIPHDNPHHTLDVGEHCWEARWYVERHYSTEHEIAKAALWHDVGKPYVKAFIDSKGEPCDTAHYYQHQNVGAWISYGFGFTTPHIAWLISTHMEPFMNTKYYRALPPYLKEDIDILHKADLEAH
jgi:predicted kinase